MLREVQESTSNLKTQDDMGSALNLGGTKSKEFHRFPKTTSFIAALASDFPFVFLNSAHLHFPNSSFLTIPLRPGIPVFQTLPHQKFSTTRSFPVFRTLELLRSRTDLVTIFHVSAPKLLILRYTFIPDGLPSCLLDCDRLAAFAIERFWRVG